MGHLRIHIDGHRFRDTANREVILHGINVAADAKFPSTPNQPSHIQDQFFDGDNVRFTQRPFTLDSAHEHFSRLKRMGYSTIRYVFTWEAIEHEGPGIYDEEWIAHTIAILRVAKEYEFYVFMDPHQDVWSRFTGGSGAPMWTVYACGLNPHTFRETEAALVQATYPNPQDFPKMIWATNYWRIANLTIWTMFFAGKDFAPRCVIDGKNIQDYLQDHFLGAIRKLAEAVRDAGDLDVDPVIGWESVNEPNKGLIGYQDLMNIPSEQKMQKGTSPTVWQAMLTGSGRACEIATWDFGGMGPYKSGTILVDPEGVSAWLPPDHDDTKYGWKRDPNWKLGVDIWAQHGVWDPDTDTVLNNQYFAKDPRNGKPMDYEYFTNHWFMDYYRRHRDMVRGVFPKTIMLCQPPVLEIPPTIKGTADDDPNMVFVPHFYDGITLVTKKWYVISHLSGHRNTNSCQRNRVWNVDVFGVLRNKYLTPAFAIKLGETAIRNCFRDQLTAIRKEGMDNMGLRPCLFSEIGIPYDMDDKLAYKTGNYSSQIAAMDANMFAIEGFGGNGLTLWVYVASNNHEWGDNWNGEDLSIYSVDDKPLPSRLQGGKSTSSLSTDTDSPSYSRASLSDSGVVRPANLKSTLSSETMTSSMSSLKISTPTNTTKGDDRPINISGYRAAEAYTRPVPTAVHGSIITYGFTLLTATFVLTLTSPTATPTDTENPTEISLPSWHFPPGQTSVDVSGGKWEIFVDAGECQRLKWWHAQGEQKITIKGRARKSGAAEEGVSYAEENGYLEQCRKQSCVVM